VAFNVSLMQGNYMRSIEELDFLVKQGAITITEANIVLNRIVDEIKGNKEELEKAGEGFSTGKMLLSSVLGSLALAGIGVGTHALTDYLEQRKTEKKMDESFKLMEKVDPELKDISKDEKEKSFSVLRAVSPTIASNPVLAANFVRRQAMNYGGAGFEEAANLARAEAAMAPRSENVMKQVAGQLIGQGVGSLGSQVSSLGRSGVEQATALSPEQIGEMEAAKSIAQEKALRSADAGHLIDPKFRRPEYVQEHARMIAIGKEKGIQQVYNPDHAMQVERDKAMAREEAKEELRPTIPVNPYAKALGI
jgi:hypothetical protein